LSKRNNGGGHVGKHLGPEERSLRKQNMSQAMSGIKQKKQARQGHENPSEECSLRLNNTLEDGNKQEKFLKGYQSFPWEWKTGLAKLSEWKIKKGGEGGTQPE